MLSLKRQHLLASFGKITGIARYLEIDWSRNGLATSLSLQPLQLGQRPVAPFFVSRGIALYKVELFGSKQ